ncbi:tetratricopeptide repeat protein [Hymenobacter cellulosilyticus]|uniref:Tetratricopeptide repeat protein n=1 Tax=Hymenobacter cellulosilyticus TaxID=2932248 RepID=A0A8T9Q0J3_9BACT|nr:tetratricopeptide repeat protein [Hymenobacter cellulosilyticus]UOQ70944.1 tetratricopeptide repeat protein [Hymenobacter cellulosilyticus]
MQRGLLAAFVLLLSIGSGVRAEPIFPVLRPAAFVRLRALVRTSPPDTSQVRQLLRLSEYHLHHYNGLAGPAHKDSAFAYSQRAQALSTALGFKPGQIRSRYIMSYLLFDSGQPAEAQRLVSSAINLSRRSGYGQLEAEGWYYAAEAYTGPNHDLAGRIRCYEQALRLYHKLGNREKEAYLLKIIADVHYNQGHYALALRELLQVLALYRAIGHPGCSTPTTCWLRSTAAWAIIRKLSATAWLPWKRPGAATTQRLCPCFTSGSALPIRK